MPLEIATVQIADLRLPRQRWRPPAKADAVTSRSDMMSPRTAALDGTRITDQYGGPIRVREAQSGWQDVDLTRAERADGTIAPKGHPGGVVQAGASKSVSGTTGTTAETEAVVTNDIKGAQQHSLAGQGKLGKPFMAGHTPTHNNVKPRVDSIVNALRTGYKQSAVIRDAGGLKAAGPGVPVSCSLRAKTKDLTAQAQANGSVSYVDAESVVRSMLRPPVAWDAWSTLGRENIGRRCRRRLRWCRNIVIFGSLSGAAACSWFRCPKDSFQRG